MIRRASWPGAISAAAAAVAALASTSAPASAQARDFVALGVKGDALYSVGRGPENGLKVLDVVPLKLQSSDRIVAIDFRVADGALYGLSEKANVYRINRKKGKLKLQFSLGAELNGAVSMDCNPVVDACRIVTDKGLNARFTFTSRTLLVDAPLTYSSGGAPRVVAIAYTNAIPNAAATELFDMDAATDKIYEQDPPNSGVLSPIADIVPKVEKHVAFDIYSSGEGENTGGFVYQQKYYPFSFVTGEIGGPKTIKGLGVNVRDLAFLPFAP